MGAALIGIVIALGVGLSVGNAGARAKRARLDYQRTKALIPGARKTAWNESIRGLKVIATATAAMAFVGWVMYVIGQRS
jgi:hypothetical protein